MNIFNNLVVNGCSHTAGSELRASGEGDEVYCRENCFGGKLAKNLKVSYVNLAMPGASNDYIYRTTMFWIMKNKELSKKSCFLIHWTGSTRAEYFYKELHQDVAYWDFISDVADYRVGHLHPGSYGHMPKEHQKIADKVSKTLFLNEVHWEINKYLNVLYLQEFLKANNIQYIFRNGFSSLALGKRYRIYRNFIDADKFVGMCDIKESFYEHCIEKGFSIKGQMLMHHKEDAHTYWANKLLKEYF